MNRSSQTPISDELLSAYIDGVVTNEEKATVEAALAADPGLAWELESLRQTVQLVQNLPPVPLPRSFVLVEAQVADVLAERRARATPSARGAVSRQSSTPARSWWREFLAFFSAGNLVLRNAAALAALFLVVVLVTSPGSSLPAVAPQNTNSSQEDVTPTQEVSPALAQAESVPVEPSATASQKAAQELPAEKAAPAASAALMSEPAPAAVAAAPAPAAMAAPAEAAMQKAPSAEMESSAPAAMMRAGPESMAEPAGLAPAGVGGGTESGPAAFRAVPADTGQGGEFPYSPSAADATPKMYAAEGENDTAMASEDITETTVAAEAVVEKAVVAEAAAVAAEEVSAESETTEKPVAQVDSPPSSADSAPPAWTPWGLLQIALAGLVVLLAALWLNTTRA